MAAFGTKAGVADLMFLFQGRLFALELKRPNGRLSREQREMLAAFDRAGAFTAVGYGLDAALAIIEAWGLIRPAHPRTSTQAALSWAA